MCNVATGKAYCSGSLNWLEGEEVVAVFEFVF